jgi:hypothetical protein
MFIYGKAFRIRNSHLTRLKPRNPISFVATFLTLKMIIYISFEIFGLVVCFTASLLIYPTFPRGEKIVILFVVSAVYPAFITLIDFTLYWSCCKDSFAHTVRAVSQAFREHAGRSYFFFLSTGVFGIASGLLLPIFVLRSPLPYVARILGVSLIIAAVTMWLRGVRFEYKNSLFLDESRRHLRF